MKRNKGNKVVILPYTHNINSAVGSKNECAYCGRTGKMVYVPDAWYNGKYQPVFTCNLPDCSGGGWGFYDLPSGVLD